jgi:hypothetical protein
MNYGNSLWFGTNAISHNRPDDGVFTPAEALAFDQKIDDGKPATGLVISTSQAYAWGVTNACTTSNNQFDYTGSYKTTHNTVSCSMIIKTGEY